MMDEIFGEGGFVTNVMWKRKKEISNDSDNVSIQGEYILVYAKTGQGALRLEPLSKEYIQKSYKEPTEQFPEGKWRPVPLTVSKGLSGGGYTYKITTPNGTVHERLWAYPEASYQNWWPIIWSILAKITAVFPSESCTRITVRGSQRPITGIT